MSTPYPPNNVGISSTFPSKEFVCDLHRNSYVHRPKTRFFQQYFYEMVHREKKELTGGALGGVWRAVAAYTVSKLSGGMALRRHQNVGILGSIVVFFATWMASAPCSEAWPATTIHWLICCFFFSSFPFSISIWTSFVLSCLFLVGNMLSPRFRFLLRLV